MNACPPEGRVVLAALILLTSSCSREAASERAQAPATPSSERASAEPTGSAPEVTKRKGLLLELGQDAMRDLRLTTRKVESRPAGDTLTAPGSLEVDPDRLSALSTPIPARIKKIARKVGDSVSAGDELVVLESLELGRARAAVVAANARVEIARTKAELAKEQLERVRGLAKDHMSTVRDLQAAEADQAARAADLAESEVALHDAERSLALLPAGAPESQTDFILRAQASGIVVARDGVPGESAEAGHVFYRIADLTELQAIVHPFERDGVRIDASAAVRVLAAAHPGKSFPAIFVRSGPEVDRDSRTLPVRLSVPNGERLLLPGMSVTAEIRLTGPSGSDVLTVPVAAVQRIERDWCVFVPRGGGRFERRVIARGRDLGGEVEVLSGLASGEECVVEGAFVLRSESARGADTGDGDEH